VVSEKAASAFPGSVYGRAPHFTSGDVSCTACTPEEDGDRMIARLLRAAYRNAGCPEIPGELLRRILASREDTMAGLVSVLASLAVSPLLAFSIGL
jgi:hypothetical protein